ncbi:aldose 1-epimerase [Hyphomonas sp.]|uniref:aldose 1-epimerase n=1 Tax=Hyphomonas sp. TaxID=87 RepID=UPI003918AB1A
MIELNHEGFSLGLLPEAGGSVGWLRKDGQDILRPARVPLFGQADPLETAGFPLFPFSGRIRAGAFHWNGREVRLGQNFPPEPHAIHGHGWQQSWQVIQQTASSVTLAYRHEAGDWPWAYAAEQRFVLSRGGLSLDLSLHNLSDEAMPAGIGWHPYFPRGDAELTARLPFMWEADEAHIPVRKIAAPGFVHGAGPARVSALDLDDPFEMADGRIAISWPERGLNIRLHTDETLRFLVLYVPPDQDYFCAEPVSHVPDMVNLDAPAQETGLVRLAPGETLRGSLSLWAETEGAETATEESWHAPVR